MVNPSTALGRLEAWLEMTRGPGGYGGPVAHWWGQCLRFTGAAADWRYEGVILGYLRLWQRSGSDIWLERACRAADDVAAQALPSGGYRYSSFELNPAPFGTPHEAACDVALLRLALALRGVGRSAERAERYATVAANNLRAVFAGQLWDSDAGGFRDIPGTGGFVPNKQATAAEAWLALAEWEQAPALAERYALPALRLVARAQQREGPPAGGIDQILSQSGGAWGASGRFFPLYVARCLPPLVAGAQRFGDDGLADAAREAARFIVRHIDAEGACPLLVYANGAIRRDPRWVAPMGDVLRGLRAAEAVGGPPAPPTVLCRLLAGQDSNGGIRTAEGFGAILYGAGDERVPELRDVLHVAGWCDKAFRYLAEAAEPPAAPNSPDAAVFDAPCTFRGRRLRLLETPGELRLEHRGRTVYRWRRDQSWAQIDADWLDVR